MGFRFSERAVALWDILGFKDLVIDADVSKAALDDHRSPTRNMPTTTRTSSAVS
jgi:hypothetical protein